ncbi:MAG: hypothetical protein EOP06_08385 [Proteobacteria bacterium]|nr:MAG: hypothetical protein EOP06_08385 [Pseudomonadota bacterium]
MSYSTGLWTFDKQTNAVSDALQILNARSHHHLPSSSAVILARRRDVKIARRIRLEICGAPLAASARLHSENVNWTAAVISWQRRDVNLSPDPVLELTAVASEPLLPEQKPYVHRACR